MNALEPLRIQEAAGIADDEAAIHIIARHGIPAAVGQRLRAVAHQLAAVEKIAHIGMRLQGLKRRVRIEARVFILQRDHQSDGDAIVLQAVNPAAAVHL